MTDATYGWIIDRDYLAEEFGDERTDVGVMGPRNIPDDIGRQLAGSKKAGRKFRMYDDDGELYYAGRIIVRDENTWEGTYSFPGAEEYLNIQDDEEQHFGPLWDFGLPNAGATEIRYRHQTTGKWTTL